MDKAKSCGHFPTGSNVDNFWQFVRKAEYKELSTLLTGFIIVIFFLIFN